MARRAGEQLDVRREVSKNRAQRAVPDSTAQNIRAGQETAAKKQFDMMLTMTKQMTKGKMPAMFGGRGKRGLFGM